MNGKLTEGIFNEKQDKKYPQHGSCVRSAYERFYSRHRIGRNS